LYASSNIIGMIKLKRMRLAGYVAHMGEMGNIYKILVGKPKGNRLLERLRCRQENDVGREIMWEGVY